ncbi:MAG: thioredoxin family protein [Deltaproteobacteria bacterium]|nr:MAG: thioredoxin family protein [Deltaproteobacteria bacterium]
MKRRIRILLLTIIISIFPPFPAFASTVQVEILHSRDKYPTGGAYPILFRLKISKPWYIHGTKSEGEGLIPTLLSFQESPGLKIEKVKFPEPEKKKFSYTSKPIEIYSGRILVRATLGVSDAVPSGSHLIKGNLSYQACSATLCLPPENVSVHLSAVAVPGGTPTKALNQKIFLSAPTDESLEKGLAGMRSGAGFLLTLLGIFLWGLALNLTPCVYPLIPITVSYFGGRSRKGSTNTIVHGMLYIFGLALTNSVLGLAAALSGGMLGALLQQPLVLIFVAGVMTALGLNFFGFWEFRVPAALTKMASRTYGGYFGTFFIGLTLGIVAAPCLGPFILALITYVGQKGDPFLGFLYFFILSLGLGLPLSVLAIFSGALDKLPRSGDWLLWVRKFMGWVLVGVAAYMISPLIPHPLGKSGLLAAVAVAAGVHLGFFDRTGSGLRRFSHIKKLLGICLVCGGIFYLLSSDYQREGIKWIPYDQNIIAMAAKDKNLLILDFYADWCSPCVAMEKKVFKDPEVVRLSQSLITMRLDLTRRQPFQDEVLKQYGVRGVPTIIFLNKEGEEEKDLRVETYVDRFEFLHRMRKLLERSAPER